MSSVKQTRFHYIDRGFSHTIVLVPGWASDYRIFAPLQLPYNYLLPINFYPSEFEHPLITILEEKKIRKISLLGWSMGGFVAGEFASRYPHLISQLILVSIRIKYSTREIEQTKRYISKNPRAYLYKFYRQCFHNRRNMRWLQENLLEDYLKNFTSRYLLETLEYLKTAQIKAELLNGISKIKIVHGEGDKIAPLKEAISLSKKFRKVELLLIKEAGHIPFLEEEFSGKI